MGKKLAHTHTHIVTSTNESSETVAKYAQEFGVDSFQRMNKNPIEKDVVILSARWLNQSNETILPHII